MVEVIVRPHHKLRQWDSARTLVHSGPREIRGAESAQNLMQPTSMRFEHRERCPHVNPLRHQSRLPQTRSQARDRGFSLAHDATHPRAQLQLGIRQVRGQL